MKRTILFVFILLTLSSKGQAPQGINYQGVVRDGLGNIISNQVIGVRFDIHQGSATGIVVYSETHSPTSDQFGGIALVIGQGTVLTGNFSNINWAGSSYFNEVLLDVTGGTNYVSMGTTQLMSVPYALYANTAGTAISQSQPSTDYLIKINGVDIRDSTLDFVKAGGENFFLTKTNYFFAIDPNLKIAPVAGTNVGLYCYSGQTSTSDSLTQASVYVGANLQFQYTTKGSIFPIGCCGQFDMPNHNGQIYYVPLNATPVTLNLFRHDCTFGDGWSGGWSGTFYQAFPNDPAVTGFNLPATFSIAYERR